MSTHLAQRIGLLHACLVAAKPPGSCQLLGHAVEYLEHCTYGVLLLQFPTDSALAPSAPCASAPAPAPSPYRALSPHPVILNNLQQAQQVGAAGCSRARWDSWDMQLQLLSEKLTGQRHARQCWGP